MIKEFTQTETSAIINFTRAYCETEKDLLNSLGFKTVLDHYIKKIKRNDSLLYDKLCSFYQDSDLSNNLLELFKLVLAFDLKTLKDINIAHAYILEDTQYIIDFIERIYDYWRSLERYSLIQINEHSEGIQSVNFIDANSKFSTLILKTYRQLEENLLGYQHSVYRQLSAGINVGIILSGTTNQFTKEYEILNDISLIKNIILDPPFVIYPKKNKRSGLFQEVFENPVTHLNLNKSHYFCYPAKVGTSLAFIYFHREYMNHGVSLANLFELAKPEEYLNKKPNIVYVFGENTEGNEKETVFFKEPHEDMYVGFCAKHEEIDYFGYMKKLILTLHNVRMIDQGQLPIHGAMVNIVLKNNKEYNIVIVGDSGAGKSESIEAFRTLSATYLKEMTIVFDDMGSINEINGDLIGYGTEIGAFVRLDDLDSGYPYKVMDRAIFMNPDKGNARLLIPITSYNKIVKGYKIDMVLYANNYDDDFACIEIIETLENSLQIFKDGKRKAKGTTSEEGIVSSYFSNPFGVVQRKEQSEKLIHSVFSKLYENKIPVGVLYTRLGIDGFEQRGPQLAAEALLKKMI